MQPPVGPRHRGHSRPRRPSSSRTSAKRTWSGPVRICARPSGRLDLLALTAARNRPVSATDAGSPRRRGPARLSSATSATCTRTTGYGCQAAGRQRLVHVPRSGSGTVTIAGWPRSAYHRSAGVDRPVERPARVAERECRIGPVGPAVGGSQQPVAELVDARRGPGPRRHSSSATISEYFGGAGAGPLCRPATSDSGDGGTSSPSVGADVSWSASRAISSPRTSVNSRARADPPRRPGTTTRWPTSHSLQHDALPI